LNVSRIFVALALLACLVLSPASLHAQLYPFPGSDRQAAVLCTGCKGINAAGEINAGKPTWPYSQPIVRFVGRVVDSSSTVSVQNDGIRTLRAGRIKVAKTQRGSAPPRAYIQLGSAVAAYNLSTFFTTTLGSQMQAANKIPTGQLYQVYKGRTPFETFSPFDEFLYAEGRGTGWSTVIIDGQDRLFDYDYDDRGYLYAAYSVFGWGIVRDDGATGGSMMVPAVSQTFSTVDPAAIAAFSVSSKYYAVVSDQNATTAILYDVTNPASPSPVSTRAGRNNGITTWARYDTSRHLAIVGGDGQLRLYTYSGYVSNTPITTIAPASGKKFVDLDFDDSGKLWVAEAANNAATNALIRITMTDTSADVQRFNDAYRGSFNPVKISASAGYVVVGGNSYEEGAKALDARLFKVDATGPTYVDLGGFFRKYYHRAPVGYAQPMDDAGNYTSIMGGVDVIDSGGKTYLLYNVFGLGDVYEINAGNALDATVNGAPYGTANPHSQSTDAGPYPGDTLRFSATATGTTGGAVPVTWDFGNEESGLANIASSTTGQTVTHQYTGISSVAGITPRTVTATGTNDSTLVDSITVPLKVPTPRVLVPGVTAAATASGALPKVVVGDTFFDASDGSVESHIAKWNLDGTAANLKPDGGLPAGAMGSHTLTFSGAYGKYDSITLISNGIPYNTPTLSFTYDVLPFVFTLKTPTKSGTNVTFGALPRVTGTAGTITATSWTVTWTLKDKNGATLTTPQTGSSNVGTIPNFVVPSGTVISDSVVTLNVTIDPAGLSPAAQQYNSYSQSLTLTTPTPAVTKTGCAHALEPCTITASAAGGGSTADWQFTWTLKKDGTLVDTHTGNPYQPTIVDAGTYVAQVTAVQGIFEGTAQTSFATAAALCGPGPTVDSVTINASCTTGCTTADTITFRVGLFGYSRQDCDVFTWNFGDQTATSTAVPATHKYTKNGTFHVTLTITNPSSAAISVNQTIVVGGSDTGGGGDPTCTVPENINLTYSGSKGCGPGVPCKTGEVILFHALRDLAPLQGCDIAAWTFGDNSQSTSKAPSHTYTAAGQYPVQVTITNSLGSSPANVTIDVAQDTNTGPCSHAVSEADFTMDYAGQTSGCTFLNGATCKRAESMKFFAKGFNYTFQSCDKFEWNFGDGSALATDQNPTHTFAGTAPTYHVTLRVYNTNNPTGGSASISVNVDGGAAVKPAPVLTPSFPATGAKSTSVTFSVTSDIDATGWVWNFGDGAGNNNSQAAVVGKTTSISHTFATTGTFNVRVTARNAAGNAGDPTGQAAGNIVISETPEYRFLLPVVTHAAGQGSSQWRTDVQIYNPDPNVSASNPLVMTAVFDSTKSGRLTQTLNMTQATFIYADFMRNFTTADDSGPIIISTKAKIAPMIWTRTYNSTPGGGTFGQFIPAIPLTDGGTGGAVAPGNYYLAGLRNDVRYRTNIGFVNPTLTTMDVTLKVYDDHRVKLKEFTKSLDPFALVQFPITSEVSNLPADQAFSIEIDVPNAQWVIAYASFIDGASNDPVYLQAVRDADLASEDYRVSIVPGVGHLTQPDGEWRSDVTIFNPDGERAQLKLEYFDGSGTKRAEASTVLDPLKFLQYTDILKQGVLGGAIADSAGILKVTAQSTHERYPMTFSRTYFDRGALGSYGQGIPGFAAARPNVAPGKPAVIPGVRNNADYKTNVGMVNISSVDIVVRVTQLDSTTGAAGDNEEVTLHPNQTVIGSFSWIQDSGTLRVDVTGGNAWVFASVIDSHTKDPEYVSATPLP
jgi:PKD repeat protein